MQFYPGRFRSPVLLHLSPKDNHRENITESLSLWHLYALLVWAGSWLAIRFLGPTQRLALAGCSVPTGQAGKAGARKPSGEAPVLASLRGLSLEWCPAALAILQARGTDLVSLILLLSQAPACHQPAWDPSEQPLQ